jgi:cell wall assembly regulator SMI1
MTTDREIIDKLRPMLMSILALHRTLDSIEEPAANEQTNPYPPATEKEIAASEKHYGLKFPPTYRSFLKLHNGWRNFRFDFSIFGVSGPGYDALAKQWKSDIRMFEESYRKQGPSAEDLKAREKSDPDVLYLPGHPPCATDCNGDYWVFDRNRQNKDGEYELAWVSLGYDVSNRLPSFIAFVEKTLQRLRTDVKEHGRDPVSIEAEAQKGIQAESGIVKKASVKTESARKVNMSKRASRGRKAQKKGKNSGSRSPRKGRKF